MNKLSREDIEIADAFIKKDEKYHLMLCHLMASKHKVDGDVDTVMFLYEYILRKRDDKDEYDKELWILCM